MPSSQEQGEPTCLAECSIVHGLPPINEWHTTNSESVLLWCRSPCSPPTSHFWQGECLATTSKESGKDRRCQELIAAAPAMPGWKKMSQRTWIRMVEEEDLNTIGHSWNFAIPVAPSPSANNEVESLSLVLYRVAACWVKDEMGWGGMMILQATTWLGHRLAINTLNWRDGLATWEGEEGTT